ncbi:MAG: NifB/NifX family molybdenum-iron cluster-binding protein [Bacillota bacterium]|jgi:predicted Fe-Mo cluster-binding NifX family protein
MKLALAVFEDRISVIFDNPRQILLALIRDNLVVDRREADFSTMSTVKMIKKLKEESVSILICGAITDNLQQAFERNEIKVIPWISGNVQKVLDAWIDGTLVQLVMPGCCKDYAKKYSKE